MTDDQPTSMDGMSKIDGGVRSGWRSRLLCLGAFWVAQLFSWCAQLFSWPAFFLVTAKSSSRTAVFCLLGIPLQQPMLAIRGRRLEANEGLRPAAVSTAASAATVQLRLVVCDGRLLRRAGGVTGALSPGLPVQTRKHSCGAIRPGFLQLLLFC